MNIYTVTTNRNRFTIVIAIILLTCLYSCCFAETPLQFAVERGDMDTINCLIASGIEVNSGLVLACRHLDCIEALIDAGADINTIDTGTGVGTIGGMTVLMHAAQEGQLRAIKLLIARGANVNARDADGKTALMYASDADICKSLIAAGASVNTRDKLGKTALMYAATGGYAYSDNGSMCRALILAGANVNAKDNEGRTALAQLTDPDEGHEISCIKVLIAAKAHKSDLHLPPYYTPLMVAAITGDQDRIRDLTASGVDPNQDAGGITALTAAVLAGNLVCVKALIAAKADPNRTYMTWGEDGSPDLTPLDAACQVGDVRSVKALLEAGASVRNGDHSVFDASDYGHADCLKTLIATGANVNARWGERTALMAAADRGNTECVTDLIAAGADVNATDTDHQTALIIAAFEHHADCIRSLIAAGAAVTTSNDGITPLIAACENDYDESRDSCIMELIPNTDAKARYNNGKTALMYVATAGYVRGIAALLAAGADVNATDDDGKTALMWASKSGQGYCVEALIRAKADTGATDALNHTALMYAQNSHCVAALVAAGAGLNAKDNDGNTALMLAKSRVAVDGPDVVAALVTAGAQ